MSFFRNPLTLAFYSAMFGFVLRGVVQDGEYVFISTAAAAALLVGMMLCIFEIRRAQARLSRDDLDLLD